jgi:hypothetical protein
MKPKTRNILLIVGLILMTFAGIFGYVGYRIYSFFSAVSATLNKEVPDALKETKVFKGEGFLRKTEFFKLNKLAYQDVVWKGSEITDEKEKQKFIGSETAKDIFGFADIKICGEEIIAAGKFGGYVFDRAGSLKREILFEPKVQKLKVLGFPKETFTSTLDNLRIIDADNDGKCEFISQSSSDGVTIFDEHGNAAWRYGDRSADLDEYLKDKTPEEEEKEVYVTEATTADLTDDGVSEYIISIKNDGVHALDLNKNEIWFQPAKFPTADFRVADFDGDGKTELLEFQGMSSTIRDKKTGGVIRKAAIDGWRKDFLIYEDAARKKSVRFFQIDENKLTFSDINNKILAESEAPLSEIQIKKETPNRPSPTPVSLGNGFRAVPVPSYSDSDSEEVSRPKAVWVNLLKDKPRYLAVVAPFISIPRTHFYLYDEKGALVYHELLPENAETVAVLSTANANDQILVGGKDTIWKFSAP